MQLGFEYWTSPLSSFRFSNGSVVKAAENRSGADLGNLALYFRGSIASHIGAVKGAISCLIAWRV